MSKEKVALILEHMAEQAAPAEDIRLWPAVQARLATSTTTVSRGPRMNTRLTQPNRLRTAAFIALALLLAAGALLATPQGQSWAQSMLRFFIQGESDLLPPPSLTRTATQPAALVNPAAQTAAPAPTATPPGCDVFAAPHCTIEAVQPKVAFPIRQFAQPPQGVSLHGAVLNGQGVTLVYGCPSGCFLVLYQDPLGQAAARQFAAPALVGASAQIQTVAIQTGSGPVTGEYVQGAYRGEGDVPPAWNADFDNHMLRWEEAGVVYTIQWMMPPEGTHPLKPDEALLVALAESLTLDAPETLNLDHLTSAAQASLAAGFTVNVPSYTPRGYELSFFNVDPGTGFVCLNYTLPGTFDPLNHPRLFVRQGVSSAPTELQPADPANPLTTETVTVGGAEGGSGVYIHGPFAPPENACGGSPDFANTGEALLWRSGGVDYEIYGSNLAITSDSVTQMDMVRMAESLTGVVTIPPDRIDPGHFWSLEEAQQWTGAHVFAPTVLPETYAFSHGVMMEDGRLLLVYQTTQPADLSSMEAKPVVYLYQCSGLADDPCSKDLERIPEDARQAVQINGAPGIYARGSLMETQDTAGKEAWIEEDGFFHTRRLFWQANEVSFKLELLWGEGLDQEQMVAMAESIR